MDDDKTAMKEDTRLCSRGARIGRYDKAEKEEDYDADLSEGLSSLSISSENSVQMAAACTDGLQGEPKKEPTEHVTSPIAEDQGRPIFPAAERVLIDAKVVEKEGKIWVRITEGIYDRNVALAESLLLEDLITQRDASADGAGASYQYIGESESEEEESEGDDAAKNIFDTGVPTFPVEMKKISLATNLVPANPIIVLRNTKHGGLQHNSAKLLIEQYAKASEKRMARSEKQLRERGKNHAGASVKIGDIGNRVAAVGSEEIIYSTKDCGLFSSILMAYNNHWNLRTSPDDWWFCVIRRVAIAIDKNSQKDVVRKLFVRHEGKKTLKVDVPSTTIYHQDCGWFFDQMSKKISENVKVPEYVDAVTADFTVTTSVQKIVSQVTLMSSVQEFFEYKLMLCCGIPGVDMLGTEDDWKKLQSKLKVLRTVLEPIQIDIGLTTEWWSLVEDVFCKLLATYQGEPDKDWWSRIVTREPFGSGAQVNYGGWITRFTEGAKVSLETSDFTSGLVTVPLTISDPFGVEDTAALVAGILGFTVHEDRTSGATSVQPFQGWSLLVSKDSPFL